MQVWVTRDEVNAHVTFHKSAYCRKLRAGMQSMGNVHEPFEVELDPSRHHRPCRQCWPSGPRPDIDHLKGRFVCECTGGTRLVPCPHNGGVLVEITMHGRWVKVDGERVWDKDTSYTRQMYVWPESAHRHRIVDGRVASST